MVTQCVKFCPPDTPTGMDFYNENFLTTCGVPADLQSRLKVRVIETNGDVSEIEVEGSPSDLVATKSIVEKCLDTFLRHYHWSLHLGLITTVLGNDEIEMRISTDSKEAAKSWCNETFLDGFMPKDVQKLFSVRTETGPLPPLPPSTTPDRNQPLADGQETWSVLLKTKMAYFKTFLKAWHAVTYPDRKRPKEELRVTGKKRRS